MKHEWKKHERELYGPKAGPKVITVPEQNYFVIHGQGNPNGEAFGEAVGVLYSLSYGVKMLPKKGIVPDGYFEYSVYPLEGIWSLTEKGILEHSSLEQGLSKDELIYDVMIRQPDFVKEELALDVIDMIKKKKPHPLLEAVTFQRICDGLCVQMLHVGSYDDEPASFAQMKQFCKQENLERREEAHREIYLSDARKTAPEKQKTILRYFVK